MSHPIINLVSKHLKVSEGDICNSMKHEHVEARLIALLLFQQCTYVDPNDVCMLMPSLSDPVKHGTYSNAIGLASEFMPKKNTAFHNPIKEAFYAKFITLKFKIQQDRRLATKKRKSRQLRASAGPTERNAMRRDLRAEQSADGAAVSSGVSQVL